MALLPLNAAPLGLGDINVRSALNQPLDAEIELTSLGQARSEDIQVGLASREAFARAGIERPLFLSDLTFSVESGSSGEAVVRVGSRQAIVEPFLDLLVEVNWPNGRLLREYTLLLDPPLLLDEAPAPVATPAATAVPAPAAQSAAAPSTTARPAAVRAAPSAVRQEDGSWNYGPVEKDATLWSIASDLRSLDDTFSVEQIMMALLRSNPEAFYNNNVNELKAGYVLRIDDPSIIGAISHAAAVAEFRRQGEQWLDTKRAAADAAGSRPQRGEAPPQATAGAPAADAGPRLRLSAPDAADADRLAAGSAESGEAQGQSGQRMREELVTALEAAESARQENVELRQRLAELEEQITSMQRLLSLQEDTLAAMQAGQRAQADAPAAGQQRRAAPPQPAVEQAEENPFTRLLNDPMLLGVAGGAILLLATLGWLIARRRQMVRGSLEQFTATTGAGRIEPVAATPGSKASVLADDEFDDETVASVIASAEDSGVDIMQADEDEIDVLAEADVYLAYRRFDKAEELLTDAMREDPSRRDLVMKLLEVYAASGNVDGFLGRATDLKADLAGEDPTMWSKVVAMGKRLVPGHALFAGGAASDVADAPEFPVAGEATEVSFDESSAVGGDFELDAFDAELASLAEQEDGGVTDLSETATAFGNDAADEFAAADATMSADGMMADVAAGNPEPVADELDLTLDQETLANFGSGDAGPDSTWADDRLSGADAQDGAMETGITSFDGGEEAATADLAETDLGKEIDWLAAVGDDLGSFESDAEGEDEDFSNLISGNDEIGTKLDLAKAYIDMGDEQSARNILSEVTEEGSEDQQREATELMRQIG